MTGCSDLKVLHLTTSFPLQDDSTSGIFIKRLVGHFPDTVEIIVLTPDCREKIEQTDSRRYTLHTFRYAPKQWQVLAHQPGGLPAAFGRSKRYLYFMLVPGFLFSMLLHTMHHARRCDLIHAHWTVNGVVAGIVSFFSGKPVITTMRGEDASRINDSLIHRLLLRMCLCRSTSLVTVSSRMRDALAENFPRHQAKIFFIPNGVADKFFNQQPVGDSAVVRILVLGGLIPRKGVDLVLQALAHCAVDAGWQLVLAGNGPEEPLLRKTAENLGITKMVDFRGQVPPEDVPKLFEQVDILVQASYREGRPNAVLEAMAAAVPVIGSNIDGIAELIEHEQCGLLFPAGDVAGLRKQLKKLLASPESRLRLGRAGRQHLLDLGLTWPNCAQSYLALYRQILERKQAS